jgi:hypothetical protein
MRYRHVALQVSHHATSLAQRLKGAGVAAYGSKDYWPAGGRLTGVKRPSSQPMLNGANAQSVIRLLSGHDLGVTRVADFN